MNDSKDQIILIKTLQDNQLPFSLQGAVVSIEGQDFVFKLASGEVYKLPFAAQFAGLADNTFSLTFADGQHLTSKQLIEKAIANYSKVDVHLSQHDGNAQDASQHNHEMQPKVVVKTVVEKITVSDSHSEATQDHIATGTQSDAGNSGAGQVDPVDIHPAPPPVQFSTSGGSNHPLQKVDPSPYPVNPSPNPLDPGLKTFTPLSQLQLDTQINDADHTIIAGGGSRTDPSFQAQYGVETVDVSGSNDSWTIDARIRGSSNQETTLTRIMRLDDATELTKVTANTSSSYHIVTWDSAEGRALGLAKNEFGIVYSTNVNEQFQVHVEFTPPNVDGNTSHDYGFQIEPNPTAVYDSDGNVLLGAGPAPLLIKGGAGDDKIIAGHGSDVYDGGDGHNTVDYSDYDHAITVDFQADNGDALGKLGLTDTDSAKISSSGPSQIINNVQEIFGTKFDDTFITNGGNHIFHGGEGNDTFIGYGGNNVFDGGGGNNTVDYRNVGGQKFDHIDIASDIGIDLDGVEVDLSKNITSKNGWTDTKGDFGQDQLKNIHTVYGTTHNDLIICGDDDNTIFGVAGDNLFKAGNGNNKIDGGAGHSTIDYSSLSERVDVDLNSGVATKYQYGQDDLTNIYRVIGSAGGGSLVGRTGYSNTLIGTDGETHFVVNGGTDALYGGRGTNTYTAADAVVTIHANGQINTTDVGNSLLDYYGSASGDDTIVSQGGKSTVHAGQGHTDISFQGASYSEIYSGNGGSITYHGGNSYTHLYLDDVTNTTLDYSSFAYDRFYADLTKGVIQNGSGASDTIYSGHISAIVGTNGGAGTYYADGYAFDLSITAFESDNSISMGNGAKNSTTINGQANGNTIKIGSGETNIVTIAKGGDNNTITGKDGAHHNTVAFNGNGSDNSITLGAGSLDNNITVQGDADNNAVTINGGSVNNTITMGAGGSINDNNITIADNSVNNKIIIDGDGDRNSIHVGKGSNETTIDIDGAGIGNLISVDGGGQNIIDIAKGGSANAISILDNSGDNAFHFGGLSDGNIITIGNNSGNNTVKIEGDGSSNNFTVGEGSQNNIIEITGNGSNNTFNISSGTHNQIFVDGVGINNKVDYSGTTGKLVIDLSQDKALQNGSGGSDDYRGIDYIVGNSGTGNSYISKNEVNTTFDISSGRSSDVMASSLSENTYIVTGGHGDIIDYRNVTVGATFNISSNGGTVSKGSNIDTYKDGYFGTIYGTNHGDTFNVGADMSNVHIAGGTGNDTFNLNSTWETTGSVYDGGAGNNTFRYNDTTSNAFDVKITDVQGGKFSFTGDYGSNGSFTANNFNKLILSGANPQTVDWGGGHSGIDVAVQAHVSMSNHNTFYVAGGGNQIDGGAGVTLASYSFVDYSHYSSSNNTDLTVNLDTGSVIFADGRDADKLTNINAIAGSNGDDSITGHSGMSDIFYESGGSDHIDGNGGTDNIYKATIGYVHADFSNGTIGKYDDSGHLVGTDAISHIQEFDSTHNIGGVTSIVASNNIDIDFKLSGGGVYDFEGAHDCSDTVSLDKSSTFHLDYSKINNSITIDVGHDMNGGLTVIDKDGGGTDTVHGSIKSIITNDADDTISFTHLSDLSGISIDAGGGNNTLLLDDGGDKNLDLGGLTNIKHISTIDISASQHDEISFNIDQFFNTNSEANVTMKINDGDVGRLHLTYDSSVWNQSQHNGDDVYTNKNTHDTFTVEHHALAT
ncbi:beta strand repeat-containing protein [Brucella anthropi]|uniref:beta strand repeat-containing protein n=1 Tax=Brucella anthropi TaxID=529 RepID=UPI0023602E09|nr:hypothetical protein [Brucella anthropi]